MGNLKPGATYVYESPDGGETTYAREIGTPPESRVMIGQSWLAKQQIEKRMWARDLSATVVSHSAIEYAIGASSRAKRCRKEDFRVESNGMGAERAASILAQHDARGDPRRPVACGVGEGIDDEGDADFATTEVGEIDLCWHALRALELAREDFAPVHLDGESGTVALRVVQQGVKGEQAALRIRSGNRDAVGQ